MNRIFKVCNSEQEPSENSRTSWAQLRIVADTQNFVLTPSSIIKASDDPTFQEFNKMHIPQYYYNHIVNRWS